VLVALAVPLDRLGEPFPRRVRIAVHELRERGSCRRIPHPRQLALTGIVVTLPRQSTFTVEVPFFLPPGMSPPVSHGGSL